MEYDKLEERMIQLYQSIKYTNVLNVNTTITLSQTYVNEKCQQWPISLFELKGRQVLSPQYTLSFFFPPVFFFFFLLLRKKISLILWLAMFQAFFYQNYQPKIVLEWLIDHINVHELTENNHISSSTKTVYFIFYYWTLGLTHKNLS